MAGKARSGTRRKAGVAAALIVAGCGTSGNDGGHAPPLTLEAAGYRVQAIVPPRTLCCSNGIKLHPHDPSRLYVAHAALDRISIVDLGTGRVERLADEADDASEELVTPDDMWIDPATGDVYVTEILVNGVRRIAPDGTRTRIMAGFGDGTAHPNAITGLRRPGEPLRLFVSMVSFEPGARTGIWEVDPQGVQPPQLVYGAALGRNVYGQGLRAPNGFAFDPRGHELFVPESYGGAVWAVDVDNRTARAVYQPQTFGPNDARPNGIHVRFGQDGHLLYAEQDSGRLLRLDPNVSADRQKPIVVGQLLPGIDGIAPHPDGRIFLSNFRFGGIGVVHPGGRVSQFFPLGLNLPNGHVRLNDGRIAVGDLGALALVEPRSGRITKPKQFIRDDFDIAVGVGSTGGCHVYATGFFRGTVQHVDVCDPDRPHTEIAPRRTFVAPWDVAATADTLWVTDGAAGTVWRLPNVDGNARVTPHPLPTAFLNPTGIVLGAGALFVAESGGNRVTKVEPVTGAVQGVIGGLDEPEGMAYDSCDGSLLVVEAGKGQLTRLLADGGREIVATGLRTHIRGVSVVPTLNYFADVSVGNDGDIDITTPEDGAMIRLQPLRPRTCS